jgi:hypothetical protein
MTIKVNYGELDQGILHPKLEVPRLTCMSRPGIQPGPPRWGGDHSRKELFEQRINAIRTSTYEPATKLAFFRKK